MQKKPEREEMLNFFKAKSNTDLPFAIKVPGREDGQNLIVFCSVHGNEPAGTVAAIEFIKNVEKGEIDMLKGSVTFILGNPKAFLADVRFVEHNLNRSFVDNLGSDYESTRASEIRAYMQQTKPKAILDLHSVSTDNFQILIYKNTPENKNLAETVSDIKTEFLFDDDTVPGTTLAEADRFGAIGMAVECGNHTSEMAPKVAYHHILNFLYYFNLINLIKSEITTPVDRSERETYIVVESIKPEEGFRFLIEDLQTFVFVEQGQVYAKSNYRNYVAKEDLYVAMPPKIVNTNDTNAGFLCRKI